MPVAGGGGRGCGIHPRALAEILASARLALAICRPVPHCCNHITSAGRFQTLRASSGQIGETKPETLERGFTVSDVDKDTAVTPDDSDFEGHKHKLANDEPDSDSDFEGHKHKLANDEPDSDSDFEGHKHKLANDEPDSDSDFEGHKHKLANDEPDSDSDFEGHKMGTSFRHESTTRVPFSRRILEGMSPGSHKRPGLAPFPAGYGALSLSLPRGGREH